MPIHPIRNRFAFTRDAQGYPARPNEAFHTAFQCEIPLPRRGSGAILELGCGQPPRTVNLPGAFRPVKV